MFVTAKYCNVQTKIAIVRLRHGPHKFALHAIPLINDVGERLVKTKILYVGATLKHCFLFIRVRHFAYFACLLKKKNIFHLSFFSETSGREAGTVVGKIANGSRQETDGDSSHDSDARYEGPQVKIIDIVAYIIN